MCLRRPAVIVSMALLAAVVCTTIVSAQPVLSTSRPPLVTFITPTITPEYSTLTQPISISGNAATDSGVNITGVTWYSDQGVNGTCIISTDWSGTNWTAGAIPLTPGNNLITITATDSNGQQGTATLPVYYTLPDIAYNAIDICANPSHARFLISASGYVASTLPDAQGNPQAVLWHNGKLIWLDAGSAGSTVYAVNNLGHVVALSEHTDGSSHVFLWKDGKRTQLPFSGPCYLNDNDQVSVDTSVWQYGTVHTYDTSGFDLFEPYGFNNLGSIIGVGTIYDGYGGFEDNYVVAIKSSGQIMELAQIGGMNVPNGGHIGGYNNLDEVCGEAQYKGDGPAAFATGGARLQIPTDQWGYYTVESSAHAINDAGQVLGICSGIANPFSHSVLWQSDGSLIDIGTLGGSNSDYASFLSQSGQVTGMADTAAKTAEPYVWDMVNGIRDLNLLIDPSSGWQITAPHGIDTAGEILAAGTDRGGNAHELLLVPVRPRNVSLSPSSGTLKVNTPYKFTTKYSDPNGARNIQYCHLLISPRGRITDAVSLLYDASTNKLYMRNDDNDSWLDGYNPGAGQTVANSACILDCSKTSVSKSGNDLIINWSLDFKSLLARQQCSAWMLVSTYTGLKAGYKKMGSFHVIK